MPETITAIVNKDTQDTKVGIVLIAKGGKIFVDSVTGLFGETDLKADDEVVTINNQLVEGMLANEATGIIKAAVGDVTVVAKRGGGPSVAVATAVAPSNAAPGKAPEGGVWGVYKYAGPDTKRNACIACLCCGPLGLCVLACPSDEQDAYAVNNKVYDASGMYLGPKTGKFVPKRESMQR